jgi:hypothetical protein
VSVQLLAGKVVAGPSDFPKGLPIPSPKRKLRLMPAADLSPEQWREIRTANEAGVETEELAERFGVTTNAIRQRRYREKWVTPRKVQEEAMVQRARAQARNLPNSGVMPVMPGMSALSITAETLTDKAQEGSLIAASMFLDAIRESLSNGGIKAPSTAKDLLTSMKGLRLVGGLDKEANLTVNIGGFWGSGRPEREAQGSIVELD